MNIAILGNSSSNPTVEAIAFALAKALSQPRTTTENKLSTRPAYKLVTTGSRFGVPAAVRAGAQEAPCRHVSVHYVEALHPDVSAQCIPENGFFPCLHMNFADRASFASTCGVVIVLDLNRANVGTVLTLLHSQRQDTAKLLNEKPPLCKLLFLDGILRLQNNRLSLAELVRHFGRYVDAEDMANITIFSTIEEGLQHIHAFEKHILDVAPIH